MTEFACEIELLRTLARNLVKKPSPLDLIDQGSRPQGMAQASRTNRVVAILLPGQEAFEELSHRIVARFPAIERGAAHANLRSELFGYVANSLLDRDPASVGAAEASALCDHFETWFAGSAGPRGIFVPCVITPWAAPRFSIGPVSFIFIDEVAKSDFFPDVGREDLISRDGFDRMLRLMRETGANWLACVPIEGCEQDRAEEVAELAIDLSIVALQLVAPAFGTRTMSTLDTRRGASEKRTLSEIDGSYRAGWTRMEPGLSIGTGTLADILRQSEPLILAVGSCVKSFTTGRFRFPKLEQAWCDAAYWLHQALGEPLDSIAVAKLETSLEVLLRTESTRGSQARILEVFTKFFGLRPDDSLGEGLTKTAARAAKDLVRDRSRILHGTWSTLNSHLAPNRAWLENFVITVVRRTALELDTYARLPAARDDLDDFLSWIDRQRLARTAN